MALILISIKKKNKQAAEIPSKITSPFICDVIASNAIKR